MMDTAARIAEALQVRDSSLSQIQPPLDVLPRHLPSNVTAIPNDILTPDEIRITSYDTIELLDLIAKKEHSCLSVTKAFLRRAALAQKLVRIHARNSYIALRVS